jgi:hypothetical protein
MHDRLQQSAKGNDSAAVSFPCLHPKAAATRQCSGSSSMQRQLVNTAAARQCSGSSSMQRQLVNAAAYNNKVSLKHRQGFSRHKRAKAHLFQFPFDKKIFVYLLKNERRRTTGNKDLKTPHRKKYSNIRNR